ncbi:MAG: hypothetical protein IPJ26_12170 [Bacteroidetes bacterium]|nr:hypothetical protein [Bacteroidota bacterium]
MMSVVADGVSSEKGDRTIPERIVDYKDLFSVMSNSLPIAKSINSRVLYGITEPVWLVIIFPPSYFQMYSKRMGTTFNAFRFEKYFSAKTAGS